jgi:hypothetical protein
MPQRDDDEVRRVAQNLRGRHGDRAVLESRHSLAKAISGSDPEMTDFWIAVIAALGRRS